MALLDVGTDQTVPETVPAISRYPTLFCLKERDAVGMVFRSPGTFISNGGAGEESNFTPSVAHTWDQMKI